ncbi:MAG: hypothetical protein P8X63_02350 [Desulfuromonadaceae bacterium]
MSKKKPLLLAVGLVLVAALAAMLWLVGNLDRLVAAAIEKYGSEAVGTQVRVQSVSIGLREGRGTVTGLAVANPPGYSAEPVLTLGEITLDIDPGTLTSEVPVIDEIRIGQTSFRFELNAEGKANVNMLQDNLARATQRSRAPAPSSSEQENRAPLKLRIKQLSIATGRGVMDLTAAGGRELQVEVPAITLHDIGGKEGISPENLSNLLVNTLLGELQQTAARQGVEQVVRDKLGNRATELEQKIDKNLGSGVSTELKKLLGQ